MANEEPEHDSMKQYYVLGIIVLIAVVVAGYLLRPKTETPAPATPTETVQAAPTPTPGPITKLACENEWYNPKIGFPEYYLSVGGADLSKAKQVDCTFDVTVAGKSVATEEASSPLTSAPDRGGSTFRCTTKAAKLTPRVATIVNISLKDDTGATATCSAPFVFPAP